MNNDVGAAGSVLVWYIPSLFTSSQTNPRIHIYSVNAGKNTMGDSVGAEDAGAEDAGLKEGALVVTLSVGPGMLENGVGESDTTSAFEGALVGFFVGGAVFDDSPPSKKLTDCNDANTSSVDFRYSTKAG
jgi:hypothetical protein